MQRLDYLSRRLVHPGERIRNQLARAAAPRDPSRRRVGRAAGGPGLAGARARAAADGRRARRGRSSRANRRSWRGACGKRARRRLEAAAAQLARLEAHLKHLNPQSVLERGYSITESAGGGIVRDAARLDGRGGRYNNLCPGSGRGAGEAEGVERQRFQRQGAVMELEMEEGRAEVRQARAQASSTSRPSPWSFSSRPASPRAFAAGKAIFVENEGTANVFSAGARCTCCWTAR